MKEKTYKQVMNESEDRGDIQYWVAFEPKSNRTELVQSDLGFLYNFNEDIYKLVWEEWIYFGPIDINKYILEKY